MAARRLFTTADAEKLGITRAGLRWGERTGMYRHCDRNVWAEGGDELTQLDRARAAVLARGGVAGGMVTAALLGFDAVDLRGIDVTTAPGTSGLRARRRMLVSRPIEVDGIACVDALQALVDLAALVDDLVWEQMFESALRKDLTSVAAMEDVMPLLSRSRTPGVKRIRRVLALRPVGAKPTGSYLETVAVQLARTVPGFPELERQFEVRDEHGQFVAFVDLAAPTVGFFLELDGQGHKDQPLYDARRETAVIAATGWFPGRFSYYEMVFLQNVTRRRMGQLLDQALRRPVSGLWIPPQLS